MKGMIITERMSPAVSMPIPIIGPLKSAPSTGTSPSVFCSRGWTWSANSGAKMNKPHMP